MNDRKRVLSLLLALSMIFALAACAGEGERNSADLDELSYAIGLLLPPSERRVRYAETWTLPSVLVQPESVTLEPDSKACFSVEAEGSGLTYRWQYRKNGAEPWRDCSAEGSDTAEYAIRAKKTRDGWEFRCRVSSRGGSVYSEAAVMKLMKKPAIVGQPEDLSAKVDDQVRFHVEASGGNLSYQWYYRSHVMGNWYPCISSSSKSADYVLKVRDIHDGYQFRCEVRNSLGRDFTDVATLTLG